MKYREITLDLDRCEDKIFDNIQRGEKDSRGAYVYLKESGKTYTIPSNLSAIIQYDKIDGKTVLKDDKDSDKAILIDYTNNRIILKYTEQMATKEGICRAKLSLYKTVSGELQLLKTTMFKIRVQDGMIDEEHITSSDDFSMFTDALGRLVNIENDEDERKANELIRKVNETDRISNENTRKSQETSRVNAESARVTAENTRKTQETARVSAESSRSSAEETRVSQENTRKTNETNRVNAESTRNTNENTRKTNETNRVNAENTRVVEENIRKSSEETRISSENTRKTNETARQTAETNRQTNTTTAINNTNEAADYALEQGDYANTKGDYAYQKGQEAQAIVDSAAPIINTNLQATYADKATQTGEHLHVETADDALVQITGLKGKSTQVVTENSPSPENPSPIKSVGDVNFDIVSCGKNLAKDPLYYNGAQYVASVFSKVELKPNTTYTISIVVPTGNSFYSNEYLFNAVVFLVGDGTRKSITLTTKNNLDKNAGDQYDPTKKAWIILKNSGGFSSDNTDKFLQIELGQVPNSEIVYEPYQEDRITIDTTNQKFRGFQSGVKDGYGFKDGEFGYWQRVNERTVNGSVMRVTQSENNNIRVHVQLETLNMSIYPARRIEGTSNKFKTSDDVNTYEAYECVFSRMAAWAGSRFVFILKTSDVSEVTVTACNAWLQANPVVIQYELAEPIFTPLPNIFLKSYKGVTNVFATAEVQPELTGTFKSELWAREYGKLDKTGDTKDNTVTFTEASNETDILSGEDHGTIFGKLVKSIKTFRNAIGVLSTLATTDKTSLVNAINEINTNKFDKANISNNLVTTASGLALDARQGKALKDEQDLLNDNLTQLKTNVGNNVKIKYGFANLGFEVDSVIFKHNCGFANVDYTFTCSIQDKYLYIVRVQNIDGNNSKITAVKPNPYAPESFSGFAVVRWLAVGI